MLELILENIFLGAKMPRVFLGFPLGFSAHELIVIYGSVENTHGHLGCCLKYRRNHRSYSDELELPIKKNQEALKLLHELRYQLLRCSASRTMSIKVAEVKTREGLTLPTNSSFLWTMSQSRNSSIVPRSLESWSSGWIPWIKSKENRATFFVGGIH